MIRTHPNRLLLPLSRPRTPPPPCPRHLPDAPHCIRTLPTRPTPTTHPPQPLPQPQPHPAWLPQESLRAKAFYVGDEVSETRRQSTRMAVDTKAPGQAPPDLPSLLLDGRICYIGMPVGGAGWLAGGVGWSWPAGVMPAWLPAFLDAWPGDELGWLMCGRTPLAPQEGAGCGEALPRALSRTHLRPSRPRASPAPHPSTASAPPAPPCATTLSPPQPFLATNTKLGPRAAAGARRH